MKTNVIILCLTLALAGCETVPPPKAKPPPAPPPPVEAPPPPVAGTEIDQHNMEKVRVGEEWKEYPLTTSGIYVQEKIGARRAWAPSRTSSAPTPPR